MAESLKYRLADSEECSVSIEGKDGKVVEYVIRDFDGAARGEYMNALNKRFKDGLVNDWIGMEAALLTKCMYRVDTNKLVTVAEVQSLPWKILKSIFQQAEKICGVDADAESTAKKD